VDGKVTWYKPNKGILETKYAHVLNASTTPYAEDLFGQVTGGVIHLACTSMVAGHLVPWKRSNEEGFNIVLHADKEEKEFPIRIDCLDDGQEEVTGPIYLVPIIGGLTGSGIGKKGEGGIDWLDEWLIEGIVLRLTEATKGEFSRIGCFIFYKNQVSWEIIDGFYEPFLKVMEEQGTTTAEAVCAEIISSPEHPDERYVITLI